MLRRKTKPVDETEARYGKGSVRVRADRGNADSYGFPLMGSNVPADTYYIVREDALLQMVTETPRGLWIGWDTCSGCHRSVGHCACRGGVSVNNGVRHIYAKDGGVLPKLASEDRQPLPPRLALREPIIPLRRKNRPKVQGEKHTVIVGGLRRRVR